jgi:hypothetical protein
MARVALILGVMMVMVVLLLTLTAPPASAQDYPDVQNLVPFSEEANFMSLPGYLRWMYYKQSGEWISRPEAVRIVRQQGGKA